MGPPTFYEVRTDFVSDPSASISHFGGSWENETKSLSCCLVDISQASVHVAQELLSYRDAPSPHLWTPFTSPIVAEPRFYICLFSIWTHYDSLPKEWMCPVSGLNVERHWLQRLITWVISLGPTCWKERTDSLRFSDKPQTQWHSHACTHRNKQTNKLHFLKDACRKGVVLFLELSVFKFHY